MCLEYNTKNKNLKNGGKMLSALNDFFPQIVQGKSNGEVMDDATDMLFLRESVVLCLSRIESEDLGHFWWQDKELMKIFDDLYTAGVLPLPKDPVDRLRWIALVCVECSKEEGFACGDVIIPLDFLPPEMFFVFEDGYSQDIVEEVLALRKKLSELGWEKVFG